MTRVNTADEFEKVFKDIAVPCVKDYSQLLNPLVQPDGDYFSQMNAVLNSDGSIKMQLASNPTNAAPPLAEVENIISESENNADNKIAESGQPERRVPLKVVPDQQNAECAMIEDLSKLSMFAPKKPEERLSQRRRSEQKKKEEEENKRRSAVNALSATKSSINRSQSRERSVGPMSSKGSSRQSSLTRARTPTSRPTAPVGVVTRSMSKKMETPIDRKAPAARRSVMTGVASKTLTASTNVKPISEKTPVSESTINSNDRSRDRTKRLNTTAGTGSVINRRSMMTKPAPATTLKENVRRSASYDRKSTIASKTTPRAGTGSRPIAVANRSSMLRMNALNAKENNAPNKGPMRIQPFSANRRSAAVNRESRSTVRDVTPVRSRPSTDLQNKQSSANNEKSDVFSRLAMPKKATPVRVSSVNAGTPNASTSGKAQKSSIRSVPSYIRSYNNKSGLPTSGGSHGIRAPSKTRAEKTDDNN